MSKFLLTHPTGNNFSRALLRGLQKEGLLGLFVTSIAVRESDAVLRLVPRSLKDELLRRKFEVPPSCVWTRPLREFARLILSRLGVGCLTGSEDSWFSWFAVYKDLDRFVARHMESAVRQFGISGVYAYEDAAFDAFRAARDLGLRRVYDLPIAYWETSHRLIHEERDRLPDWAVTMPGARDSQAKLERKTAELEMADVVVCPSRFVYESLPARSRQEKRCIVAEFGSPATVPESTGPRRDPRSPLRVLFAGSMTQRKGLADVFAAMRILNRIDIKLVVFGSLVAPMGFYRGQYADFIHEGPRPNAEVLRLMQTCDVLVLPSIVEGRALVQQEAMSCGLPLIITPYTGGDDLVEEGKTGFLIPIRSPDRIAERIAWFADHRDELEGMREHVRQKAALLTWEDYARKIIGGIGA